MAGRTRLHSDVVFGDTTQDDDISFRNPKKRILFDEENTNTPVEISEHMKCYLRIRPFSEEEVDSKEDQKCLTIEDENTVATHAPKESHTFKNCTHGLGKTTHKFKFSRIFDSVTTQKDFFNETMLGLVKDFIDGQNCLVFTYGVTSSGKTYTIQGKPKDAGILPRALDVLFNSINGKQWPNNNLKPKMFMDRTLKMVTFDEPDVMSLLESSNASYGPAGRVSKDSLDEVFSDLENRVREEAAVNVEDQGLMKFSVWVSFAEIYNEQIFDLLEPIPKKKTTRRPVLRLSDDRNGSPYIRGLKEIHVTSADEAYNLLTVGQKNLRTAVTKLNHQSSRSHCIFNIKILRVVDKGNPNHARVSMLSLCDLAGSERHSKTQSKGERLKEAGNINTSLMTLGRCIEALRNNQHHKDKTQLIPFRDSKLTRLFQNFFSGRGKAAMIVNVNQCASMFDETLHVFKFSAVAKQVVVVQKPEPPPKKRLKSAPPPKVPRPSIPWATPGAADMSLMNSALKRGQQIPLPEDDFDEDMDSDSMDDSESAELVRIIDSLREKLKVEKHAKLLMERDIRDEVCKEMMEQIVKIENDYEEQIREREILAEEMMEKRIKILTNTINPRKRQRQEVMEDEDDEWVSSMLLHQEKVKVQERDEELKELKKELETTKSQLNKYIKEQENYIAKNTSLQFKLADTEQVLEQTQKDKEEAKDQVKKVNNKMDELVTNTVEKRKSDIDLGDTCLLETLSQQLQQAKDQIKEQETEIKELNAMLTEAGETFQQTDTEIKQLKEVINDDEEKLKQQQTLISELQTALEESTNAVTTAEERLVKRDEQIIKLESENSELEEKLKNQKNCCLFLEETLKQKDEEITGWKNKFAREEDESFKREHALINGYKAEISNLKTQIHQLKAEQILRSNANNCGSEEKNHHFKENLSRQIKDLQAEFMKNSSVTAELESALHIARLTSEDLESQLKELDDIHNSFKELQDNFGELEKKMATKVEENLTATKSLQKDIEQSVSCLTVLEDKVNKLEQDVLDAYAVNKDLEETKTKLELNLERDLEFQLEEKSIEITDMIECKVAIETKVNELECKVNEVECLSKEKTTQLMELNDELNKIKVAKEMLEADDGERAKSEERITELEKEIEDLKSKPIIVKDDVDNVKDLESKNVEIENLEKQVDSLQQENLDKIESCDKLKCELEVKNVKLQKLLDLDSLKQDKSKHEKSLKEMDSLSKTCKQHEIMIREQDLKIKSFEKCDNEKQVLVEEVELIQSKCEKLEKEKSKLKTEIDGCKFQMEVSDREIKNLNQAISQQQKLICQQAEKIKELVQCDGSVTISHELDTLKSDLKIKSETLELHKDKLTKVENDLVRISNELNNKEQIIENLKENLNQFRENECLSPTSQSHCARKLRKEKIEVENQLIEAKFKIKQLENEVHNGVMSSPRHMVHTESIQRASVTSPTVHRELNRSQEREQNLRSQLQQASQTVKQQNEKISELEKQILETSTKLRAAEDSLKQRQSLYGVPQDSCVQEDMKRLREEHAKRWEIIQNLEKDLQKKESKLQSKSQVVKDLKQTMEMERDKFEAALRDANANEAVIEELKNAIALQEETMEEQDRYIQQKEETINKLQQDVEKYTDKYHQLLTTSGDSGKEMREMTRENVRQSAEVDQFKKNMEEMNSKLQKLQEEKLELSNKLNEKCKELSELETILKEKREECDKLQSSTRGDNGEDLDKIVEELKRNNQKLKDDKLLLSAVIKENNDELKEMEKLVSEKRKECEELKSQNNTDKLETVESKSKEQEHVITELKNKIKDKDHCLRDSHKEARSMNDELSKVRHELDVLKSELKEKSNAITEFGKQVQHKNQEIIRLQRSIEDKSTELNNWKLERDKLVDGLEGIMKKQQKEIHDLKKQKSELEDKQTSRHRHRSTTQHEKLIIVPDSTEDIVIKEEIPDVFQSPPRRAPSRRGRKRKSPTLETPDMLSSAKKEVTDDNMTFVSEDGDISHHIEIDATPAIAAKTLRKSRKKRSSVDLLREEKCDKENKKSTRGRKQKASKTTSDTPETNGKGLSRIGSIMSAIKESPITRTAKKLLEDITETSTPNKEGDITVEVEDHGTQMSPAMANKRSRRKHTLYKESLQISEPLDCGSFVGQSPDDVHTTINHTYEETYQEEDEFVCKLIITHENDGIVKDEEHVGRAKSRKDAKQDAASRALIKSTIIPKYSAKDMASADGSYACIGNQTGYVLIINFRTDRDWADKDEENIIELMSGILKFEYSVVADPTKAELVKILENISSNLNENYKSYYSFMVFLMAHGSQVSLKCSSSKAVGVIQSRIRMFSQTMTTMKL
ncbi:kinesin family member 20 [Mytilus galloprovincialis]|uniref:Kinesin family member 20 n=1 Tax=Mytilus galloprovincialis TaxID=29158 RepID=A0A8B6BSZ3_MYTGA|nr:kinesin family member 20 [Mytilus galloprovincialis]